MRRGPAGNPPLEVERDQPRQPGVNRPGPERMSTTRTAPLNPKPNRHPRSQQIPSGLTSPRRRFPTRGRLSVSIPTPGSRTRRWTSSGKSAATTMRPKNKSPGPQIPPEILGNLSVDARTDRVLSAVLGKYSDLVVVSALLVINAVLSFMQERRAAGVVEALRRLQVSARVRRDSSWQVIPAGS